MTRRFDDQCSDRATPRLHRPHRPYAGRVDDTGLSIERAIPELRAALGAGPSAVLVAPPGSGKTTVVPLRLLDEPWLGGAKIVVLEPRRIATRAAAHRMAHLLGEPVGETVGYVTRGDRRVGPQTRIEVITEGVLTRRLQRDPELTGTGLVIFDELHERNLQTDLGLALALDARQTLRPDLRLLAMSATIDATRIAALLGGDEPAPIVVGEAAAHPVEIRWKPLRDRRIWWAPGYWKSTSGSVPVSRTRLIHRMSATRVRISLTTRASP